MIDPYCKHDDMCKDVECNCDCHYNMSDMIGLLERRTCYQYQ